MHKQLDLCGFIGRGISVVHSIKYWVKRTCTRIGEVRFHSIFNTDIFAGDKENYEFTGRMQGHLSTKYLSKLERTGLDGRIAEIVDDMQTHIEATAPGRGTLRAYSASRRCSCARWASESLPLPRLIDLTTGTGSGFYKPGK